MLDERSLRRPDPVPHSVPVTLTDGQAWLIPKPVVYLSPVVRAGKVVSVAGTTSLGAEFDDLMKSVDEGDGGLEAIFGVAVFLLSQNYDLPDKAYGQLLRFNQNDEASVEILKSIMAIARGIGPKPLTAGIESAA